MHPAPALFLLALLAACGPFPTAGEPTGRGDYPTLLPLTALLEGVPATEEDTAALFDAEAEADAALLARAEGLRSRADMLLSDAP
jgi:hypothetical protein